MLSTTLNNCCTRHRQLQDDQTLLGGIGGLGKYVGLGLGSRVCPLMIGMAGVINWLSGVIAMLTN